jgi:hypothetical protein
LQRYKNIEGIPKILNVKMSLFLGEKGGKKNSLKSIFVAK